MSISHEIEHLANHAIGQQLFPGCVVAFSTPRIHDVIACGQLAYEPDSPKTDAETLYDVASVTKSIPTALLAAHLIDRGLLRLDDRVSQYVPELAMPERDDLQIYHLLTFTISYGFGLADVRPGGVVGVLNAIYHTPLTAPAGARFVYANASMILLGLVIERVMNCALGDAAELSIFRPLGITGITFRPDPARKIAPSEIVADRGVVHGIVHDETAFLFASDHKQIGSAGAFGTAPAFLKVLEAIVDATPLVTSRLMTRSTIDMMLSRQTPTHLPNHGLGWNIGDGSFMGKHAGALTFGKTGFTGCSIVADRGKRWACSILSNSTFPSRSHHPQRVARMNEFRAAVADLVDGAA